MRLETRTNFWIRLIIAISNFPLSFQSPHCYVSEVRRGLNNTLCASDYFVFPETWNEPGVSTTQADATRGQSETDSEFTLCCPNAPEKVRGKKEDIPESVNQRSYCYCINKLI